MHLRAYRSANSVKPKPFSGLNPTGRAEQNSQFPNSNSTCLVFFPCCGGAACSRREARKRWFSSGKNIPLVLRTLCEHQEYLIPHGVFRALKNYSPLRLEATVQIMHSKTAHSPGERYSLTTVLEANCPSAHSKSE